MTAAAACHRQFWFVGEKRSNRAIDMKVTWEHGRLAACTLFRALVSIGLDPADQTFVNLWYDDGELDPNVVRWLQGLRGTPVVAMGLRVSKKLAELGVRHRRMTHPAARGRIRLFRRYRAHVRGVLFGAHE